MSKYKSEVYQKIIDYNCSFRAIETELSEINGTEVVFTTGSAKIGKSTILNALIKGKEAMSLNEDCNIVVDKVLNYNEQDVFEIEHEAVSRTSPDFYLHKDRYYIEFPAITDDH